MTWKTKQKKIRKQRGHRTHGYGSPKKNRGKGSHGGRGYAGSTKHMKLWIKKNEPDRIGKRGFQSLKGKGVVKVKAINLRDLARIISRKNITGDIDLKALGYDKLLGSGQASGKLTVKGRVSAKAKEKIEKAGGNVLEG